MQSGGNYNSGRGGGGRGRGRGGGRGNYQEQGGRGGGRGNNQEQGGRSGGGRGNYQEQGGRSGGGRGNYQEQGGRSGGGRGNYQEQGGRGYDQNQPNQGGGRGWGAPPQGGSYQPSQQQCVSRPPVQVNQPAPPNAWGNRPPQTPSSSQPSRQWVSGPPVPVNQPAPPNAWGNRPLQTSAPPNAWGNRPLQTSAPPKQSEAPSSSSIVPAQAPSLSKLKISEDRIEPIPRPDNGGTLKIRTIGLLVNHFQINFDKKSTIIHYDVDIKFVPANGGAPMKKALRKSETRFIKDQLFLNEQSFAGGLLRTAFDGEKNIFSAIRLPEGNFPVVISEGEDLRSGRYMVSIKAVNELPLSKLNDYLRGTLNSIPRDILQGMDLVMKENPLRKRNPLGKNFFSSRNGVDLRGGLEALQGFQQSLKPTLQGLALCLDFSVLSFRKPLPVIEFLKQHVRGFRDANDVKRLRRDVDQALKGLLVKVDHRRTKQKYTIAGLTREDACDSYFDLVDPEGVQPPRNTSLLDYFREKWGKNVVYQNIPCLELGKGQKSNKVPMEFCRLAEGQRFPKEELDKDTALLLKNLTLAKPEDRMGSINGMVRAEDGPYGEIAKNFGIELDVNMTKVMGRVIGAPQLKIGNSKSVKVDDKKCQWNLLGKSFIDSKSLDRWAMIDFTDRDRSQLHADAFINNLIGRCGKLGIRMAEPLVYRLTRMNELSSMDRLHKLFRSVVEEANGVKLQMIMCVMTKRDPGYKNLKWLSETQIGVVTQCCLSFNANKGQDQDLANLCLKINAKLGGNNFEVSGRLLEFAAQDHVLFIGADVNHPAPMNKSCPSIAAVVGTVNWPAANRYAARVSPQAHRCEKINNFGALCLDLVKTYADLNKVRPKRIVVFRDGVSEGQFEMVLAQELLDMKKAIYTEGYEPLITIIVAQKRHQTRLFVENRKDGGQSGNVPPGTVVDTKIVHPRDFDFYLCSHYGGIGTSKPTHYYVLWDENFFSSDQLQKLIYDMCFTFVRCTKPVSLVPPVYYADLVAYRGRMFQEVAMENPQFASASFDQKFYNLHPDLENVMFFV